VNAVVALIFWGCGAACIIDAALQPASAWTEADRNRPYWIVMLIFFGILAAVPYLVAVRPRFSNAKQLAFTKDSTYPAGRAGYRSAGPWIEQSARVAAPAGAPAAVPPRRNGSTEAFCSLCGAASKGAATFCVACGARLELR